MHRCCVAVGVMIASAGLCTQARAVVLGTTDTFQDTTTMGWVGGTTVSNSPGGMGGDEDLFLLVASNGATTGTGSKLATHNGGTRWIGNYIGAGVTGIAADMINIGDTPLQMRLVVFSSGDRWTSTNFVTLAPGADWQRVVFPISAADLTEVLGGGTYAADLAAVDQIMFRHDGAAPSFGGESITGLIGIDNISAVPAPGAMVMLGLGGIAAARRRR